MWQRWNQSSHIFEKSSDNGASWTPMPIAWAGIEGAPPPVTIPPNIAFTNVYNNFTASQGITAVGITELDLNTDGLLYRLINYVGSIGVYYNPIGWAFSIDANGRAWVRAGYGFPAAQYTNSDPNTLDDYEEGTWIPTLISDGGGAGTVYNNQSGSYTKVGNIVTASFDVGVASADWVSGNLLIAGFPFYSVNQQYVFGGFSYFTIGLAVTAVWMQFAPGQNATYVPFKNAASGSYDGLINPALHLTPGSRFIGTITYRTTT